KYPTPLPDHQQLPNTINHHYIPPFPPHHPPSTLIPPILPLPHNLHSISSFFSIHLIPTPSRHPYRLTKQPSAILQILLHR
ncbi:glycine--tRNA ligase subunit beta, partial [Bacillus altitudinis]|uniref:glycine--tRNA ligase subunit beta n=1 Tax=Bacillus altitudinis TaxID=293387 RepID=UPI00119DBD6F